MRSRSSARNFTCRLPTGGTPSKKAKRSSGRTPPDSFRQGLPQRIFPTTANKRREGSPCLHGAARLRLLLPRVSRKMASYSERPRADDRRAVRYCRIAARLDSARPQASLQTQTTVASGGTFLALRKSRRGKCQSPTAFLAQSDQAFAFSSKTATAGSVLPSKNSRKAPPPVEM